MAGIAADRLRLENATVAIARNAKGRITNRTARAFAMVEAGDTVEVPLLVNGVEVARLTWKATAQANKRGVVYLRMIVGDNCPLTKLVPDLPAQQVPE